jgi:PhzF family phenazine biosynthesis protein
MKQRSFQQVDVFTERPYYGNPLAVVLDGAGLSDAQMQHFAQWTNLSETTFVLPATLPQADYRVRIFTPGAELPFAGHPTLGTCHAWLKAGGQAKQAHEVVQQCAVGLVRIRRQSEQLAFAAPELRRSDVPLQQLQEVLKALAVPAELVTAAQWLDNGPHWLGLLLDHPETVLALNPDHSALKAMGVKVGVAARSANDPQGPSLIRRGNREARAFSGSTQADLHVRAFASAVGVPEDPVTGSLNASLAQWLIADGLVPEQYVASQGVCLGRDGRVHIERDITGQVWVGGQVSVCVSGTVTL